MNLIHYGTGGVIPGEEMRKKGIKPEFSTLCGMKFERGGSDLMKSGWGWKEYLTCKRCKHILENREDKEKRAEQIMAKAKQKVSALYNN